MTDRISRRTVLACAGGGLAAAAWLPAVAADAPPRALKGRVNHSVSRWCYGRIKMDEFCRAVKAIGIKSIELVGPKDWPALARHGLVCAMGNGAEISLTEGFNRPQNHDRLVAGYEALLPAAAAAGVPNLICFSGNRNGLSDDEGIVNCVAGLKRLAKAAEQHKVNIVMELLNSKTNHPDYQCDHTAWGAEVCRRVGSPRVKLLYDIYHMQIMEGDLIATIRKNIQHIAHFHTGGVPGRNEIDDTQEIHYPAVCRAIVDTGYQGYIGQEFIPKGNPLESLRRSVEICDV